MISAYSRRRLQSLRGDPDAVGKLIRRWPAGQRSSAVVGAATDGGLLVAAAAPAIRAAPSYTWPYRACMR